jgi:hypothetical protein
VEVEAWASPLGEEEAAWAFEREAAAAEEEAKAPRLAEVVVEEDMVCTAVVEVVEAAVSR